MKAMNVLVMPGSILPTGSSLNLPQELVEGEKVRLFDSSLPIRSTIESVWEVLTDYENIEAFKPGIEKSGLLPPLPGGEK